MDRKSFIILAATAVLLLAWHWGVGKFFPPVPAPPQPTNFVATATNDIAGTNAAITGAPVPAVASTNKPGVAATPTAPEETLSIETPEATYTFTSHGGGFKRAQLKHYTESIRRKGGSSTNELVTMNEHGHSAVLAMQADAAFGDNVFTLTKTPTNTVIAEKTLPSGLRIVKQFEPVSNHTVRAHVWFQNTSTQTITLPAQSVSIGAANPAGPEEISQMSGLFWFNGEKAEHVQDGWFDNYAFACFFKRPRTEYESGANAVQWASAHNQFFVLAVVPRTNAVASAFKGWRWELPNAVDAKKPATHVFEGAMIYPATNIAGGQFIDRQFTIYAGPKQEKALSQLGRGTSAIMDFGFFSPISKVFLRSMNWLHNFMPYGVAIIVLTIIIKGLFWPLTAASTRSMKRMQALGPEMAKIKEKYKDDPAKANQKTMQFMRENKINPMNGCWPVMIQMPIFFALFRMIPNAIELRGTPFLWVRDLSRADTLFYLPGLDFPFNLLPLFMGVTMFWQARLTPPSPGMDPAQQAMMKYMPLMFLVFLYNQPSGLVLYWTVQNLLTILQTKMTKAKEAAAAAKPVVVTAPAKKRK
jgi:YidC/Oxa1 family membrane protein insertase